MPLKVEVGGCALNDHGNYIVDHGKIMEKSWNFVFEFLWEPWYDVSIARLIPIINLPLFLVYNV